MSFKSIVVNNFNERKQKQLTDTGTLSAVILFVHIVETLKLKIVLMTNTQNIFENMWMKCKSNVHPMCVASWHIHSQAHEKGASWSNLSKRLNAKNETCDRCNPKLKSLKKIISRNKYKCMHIQKWIHGKTWKTENKKQK